MTFRTLDELHRACRAQVAADAANGVHSIYLPNTVFTDKPRWCLVTSEPSLSRKTPQEFQAMIDRGFTNFLYSRGDFILQFCAFEFLCDRRFDYIITDLSKGAMTVNAANVGRNARYLAWLNILRAELEFYGNPRRIAVGRVVEEFLQNNGLGAQLYVRHYSGNNSGDFVAFYNEHPQDHDLAEGLDERLREFMETLFNEINYPDDLRREAFNRIFAGRLPTSSKGMFLEYRESFMRLNSPESR